MTDIPTRLVKKSIHALFTLSMTLLLYQSHFSVAGNFYSFGPSSPNKKIKHNFFPNSCVCYSIRNQYNYEDVSNYCKRCQLIRFKHGIFNAKNVALIGTIKGEKQKPSLLSQPSSTTQFYD